MPNRIWQAEEEKWEKRRLRAEKVLTHIRELRRLEAEEEADEQPIKSVGQPIETASASPTPKEPTPAPVPPLADGVVPATKRPQSPKLTARDVIPELLAGGPMTVKAMAEAAERSQQAISNALKELVEANVVKEERSTFPGFRHQYRLTTQEERDFKPQIARFNEFTVDQEEDQESD